MRSICPKCGANSFFKVPSARIMRQGIGSVHIADEHYFECLKCKHKGETIRINTKEGECFEKPFWKRILSLTC